jgi:hypothetical protein
MEDVDMRELLEGVAAAGSWAVWMGVFSWAWQCVSWQCAFLTGLGRYFASVFSP